MTFDTLSLGSPSVINLTDTPTDVAIALASTCETVHIAIHHVPSVGKMVVPVRIVEAVEDAIWENTTDPIRFVLLQSICKIMNSPE